MVGLVLATMWTNVTWEVGYGIQMWTYVGDKVRNTDVDICGRYGMDANFRCGKDEKL